MRFPFRSRNKRQPAQAAMYGAPRVRVSDGPSLVPSHKHNCQACGTEVWCSTNHTEIPIAALVFLCYHPDPNSDACFNRMVRQAQGG